MGNAEYMGRRGRTAKRKTTTKENKKERKESTKTKGGKVEVMASFGIFLQLAILCFFTVSKVHAKHFMVETEGDVGDVEGGDYSSGLNRQGITKSSATAPVLRPVLPVLATRCLCDWCEDAFGTYLGRGGQGFGHLKAKIAGVC